MLFFSGSFVGFQVQTRMPKDSPRKSGVPDSRRRIFEDIVALTQPPVSPDTSRVSGRIKEEVFEENSGLTRVPVSASLALALWK